ncbi:HlyD family secretion protein [Thermophagus sp. OGC60D27]|uniref:HlyD family secretion protein n=1 Tax=Thermophagus sp. OGC60D27 TaxID=3458415 RepID=UPI004037C5B6
MISWYKTICNIQWLGYIIGGFGIAVILSGCVGNNERADAYGNFEAEEVVISSEAAGKIQWFDVKEGDLVEEEKVIALIDTTFPRIELDQLLASKSSAEARLVQLQKSVEVQKERLKVIQKEVNRVTKMFQEKALSAQKYDEVTGQFKIAQKELEQMQSQALAIRAEERVVEAKINAAKEKLARCKMVAPFSGTVLQKYAEAGEVITFGKPVLKMANTNELILRAYISGSQLDDVQLGQEIEIGFDKDKNNDHRRKGVISWVSSSAEFTPKIIQTKEERVDLVYAIKIRVPNSDGKIKIGMPGEVFF